MTVRAGWRRPATGSNKNRACIKSRSDAPFTWKIALAKGTRRACARPRCGAHQSCARRRCDRRARDPRTSPFGSGPRHRQQSARIIPERSVARPAQWRRARARRSCPRSRCCHASPSKAPPSVRRLGSGRTPSDQVVHRHRALRSTCSVSLMYLQCINIRREAQSCVSKFRSGETAPPFECPRLHSRTRA